MRPIRPGPPPADANRRCSTLRVGLVVLFALGLSMAPNAATALSPPRLLVVDPAYGPDLYCPGGCGAVLSVDFAGNTTEVSDFNDPSQGPVGYAPGLLALESSQSLLAATSLDDTHTVLLRIDLGTGRRTMLSDLLDPTQGPVTTEVMNLLVDQQGRILLLDRYSGTPCLGSA